MEFNYTCSHPASQTTVYIDIPVHSTASLTSQINKTDSGYARRRRLIFGRTVCEYLSYLSSSPSLPEIADCC